MQDRQVTIDGRNQKKIKVKIRASKKAKRLILKFNPADGFELVRPHKIKEKIALNFLHKHNNWVLDKVDLIIDKQIINLFDGVEIPILGGEYFITHSNNLSGATHFDDNKIIVSGYKELVNIRAIRFLKSHLAVTIDKIATEKASQINANFSKISIRDTKTRWGSCSSSGNLSFSWRLIFAPFDVLEYVICHEVSHLKEMNHSDNFWNLVKQICPDYKLHKKWLRIHGMSLYLYQ